MRSINLIVVHCSATPAGADIGVSEIRRMHRQLGWSDIGYHDVIRRDGSVERGRPYSRIGAHAMGYNAKSIGVCLVGGADYRGKAEANFTKPQYEALRVHLHDLLAQFPDSRIVGHRDLSPDQDGDGVIEPHEYIKECPSFDVASWWRDVR